MRSMSFAMTTQQVRDQIKDLTRRFGWKFLKPGDVVRAVEKGMGLKKGEKIVQLGIIQIVSTRWEPLNLITREDVIREGFPDWSPKQFVQMLVDHYRVKPDAEVNRIEFKYITELYEEYLKTGCVKPTDCLFGDCICDINPSVMHKLQDARKELCGSHK